MRSAERHGRGDTRQRIQETALECFLVRGYERTTLREIAVRLGVTKAALYYHFKTKEDILVSLFLDVGRRMDELIEWGRRQPRGLEVRRELLAQCSVIFSSAAPLFTVLHANEAALSELSVGRAFKNRVSALSGLFREPDAPVAAQVRCITALLSLHFGTFALSHVEGDPEEKRLALLDGATELLTSAHEARGLA
ncbi:TetR/AcrR family transcriptional regulator [Streptomyces sp. NPDC049577]|uniref:TetR/AcrR family transcriptional regulator n=1 Tax=Streptomyces sp. NPDC049577 TaxID=3155153 RepID=UPI003419A1D4